MTLLFYVVRTMYINVGRSLRRIEALSKFMDFMSNPRIYGSTKKGNFNHSWVGCSPVLSHVNATLQGLASVHTAGAESMLEKEFHDFQDHSISSWFLSICATRWFGFWLDVICLTFIAVVTQSFLLMENGE